MNKPVSSTIKVSVIIPCYNQAQYLTEAVESVLKQTFTDYEIIIVNDGSTDNSKEIAELLISNNPEKQIFLINQNNQGLPATRNNGIGESRGRYILPLDADDMILPEMLQKTVSLLDSDSSIPIAYTDVIKFGVVNENVKQIEYDFSKLLYQNHLFGTSLFRKEVWESVGGYNTKLWSYEDWDFWISCGEKGFYAKRVPELLIMYRIKEKSMHTEALKRDKELKAMITLIHPNLYPKDEVKEAKQLLDNITSEGPKEEHMQNLDVTTNVIGPSAIGEGKSNTEKGPLVSVIMPTYNRSEMLKEALKSVLCQTYKNYEIIVINDAGEDVSAIIDSLNAEGKIVSLRHKENKGLAAARNTALKEAKGKYIAYLDDDDVYYPNHLETLIGFLETKNYQVAYTDAYQAFQVLIEDNYITTEKCVTYSFDFDKNRLLVSNYIHISTIAHRKDLIDQAGYFDKDLDVHEDWEFFIRLSQFCEFFHIKEVTAEFRTRKDGTNMTTGDRMPFLRTAKVIHSRYSYLVTDPQILEDQKRMEKSLNNEVMKYNPIQKDEYERYFTFLRKLEDYETVNDVKALKYRPKVSIIASVYNANEKWLASCIESVRKQDYDNWELCFTCEDSSSSRIKKMLKKYSQKDDRIKVKLLSENKGTAGNLNEALSLTTGEYIGFLDSNDEIDFSALHEIIKLLNENEDIDFIYTDEDKISKEGERSGPEFKPDWSPDTFRSYNYICHFVVIRKEVLDKLDGFRKGFEGAEDYDLFLRVSEITQKISHVPRVLYHRRYGEGLDDDSLETNTYKNAKKALMSHIKRVGMNGKVKDGLFPGSYRIEYQIDAFPTVSIIIPTKDKVELLKKCINSILKKSSYEEYKILVVDNRSEEDETFRYFEELKKDPKINILKYDNEFNFSAINNYAVTHVDSEYVIFLNNDMEIISPDWIEAMLEFAQRKDVGAVGALLYYPNETIQHAGVITGLSGIAGHCHYQLPRSCVGYMGRAKIIQNLSAVTAACLMTKRSVFDEIGGFDEKYAYAFNDVDLCLKIREKGHLVIYTPYAELYHAESLSRGYEDTQEKRLRTLNETKYFLSKRNDILEKCDPYYNPNLSLIKNDFSIKYESELIGKEFQVYDLHKNIWDKNAHIQNLDSTIKERETHIGILQSDISVRDTHIGDLGKTIKERETHIGILQSDVSARDERVKYLDTVINEIATHIDVLQSDISARDTHIRNLDTVIEGIETDVNALHSEMSDIIKERETHITLLKSEINSVVKERETHIGILQSDIIAREKHIIAREAHINDRERHIEHLDKEISDRDNTLYNIYNSQGWKVLLLYYKVRNKLFSPGSKRGLFAKIILKTILKLVKPFRNINKTDTSVGPAVIEEKQEQQISELPVTDNTPHIKEEFGENMTVESIEGLVFPCHPQPIVSIIIPLWNKWQYTYYCLDSLLKHTNGVPYEVIITDNASTDETPQMLKKISNIKVIRNKSNLGFVEACNMGAKAAKGKYVLFLNNDTQPTKGWLEAMVDLAENDSRVGAVGAKLVYPDGKLQEAGGIVWNDPVNIAWNYGRHDDPDKWEYNYVKEADYCSGACLLVRKTLFESIGLFDGRFIPCYCEDTDLAFSIRESGYKLMYQPKAEIIHFEGISAGVDTSKGMKRFQVINTEKFYNKWRSVLEDGHFANGENVFLARDRSKRVKVLLYVDHYLPEYDKDAGSFVTYEYLKVFREMDYKVIFWPDNLNKSEPYTSELQQMGIEVVYGAQNFDEYIKDHGRYLDVVFLSRPHIAIKYIHQLRNHSDAKVYYVAHDLHFLRERRRAEIEKDQRFLTESEDWKKKELYLMSRSDTTLLFSQAEQEVIHKECPDINAEVLPWIQPLNVTSSCFEDKEDIIFIGGFVHPPNEDAVLWFANEVFPQVKKELPNARFITIGSHPTEKVLALESDDIVVTGYVNNVGPYFKSARVFVAPLRYGAGFKGKIVLSMSYGLPVVTTPIGAEGIGLKEGENALIANGPKEFADKVVELYKNADLWTALSDSSIKYVKENHSFEVAKKKIEELSGIEMKKA